MGGLIITENNYRGQPMARLTNDSPDIFIGSPLAVIGLWVFALRQRFSADPAAPMPWVWDPDLQPAETEDGNPPPDGSPRKIYITSSYNVESAVRNYRPAIYVGRGGGAMRAEKISLDNKVGIRFQDMLQAYHCHGTMPITFECESESLGESSTIAETAWAFVLSSRDVFRRDFGLHDITEPVLSDTVVHKTDKECWVTTVQFQVTHDVRWSVTPIAPKLRDIALQVGLQSNPNFFLDLVVSPDNP